MAPVKYQEILIDEQDKSWGTLIKAVVAEYAVTTLFLFFTIGTVSSNCHTADNASHAGADKSLESAGYGTCFLGTGNVLNIALAFGFSIFVLVYCAASFSGGHINPAVTFGMLVARKISISRAVLYMVAQCLGACTGAGLVKAIDSHGWRAAGGGTNALSAGVSNAAGWGLETILTMALVFTVFAATDAERASDTAHLPVLAPLAIGMVVFLCHMVAIPLDGCSINPARSFGAAAVAGKWDDQWVFWVGPLCGGLIAAAAYEFLFRTKPNKSVAYPSSFDVEGGGKLPEVNAALPAFSGVEGLKEVKETTSSS
ncbi:g2932 [Coccomyxa elongata]